jgi:hypothetical protein
MCTSHHMKFSSYYFCVGCFLFYFIPSHLSLHITHKKTKPKGFIFVLFERELYSPLDSHVKNKKNVKSFFISFFPPRISWFAFAFFFLHSYHHFFHLFSFYKRLIIHSKKKKILKNLFNHFAPLER